MQIRAARPADIEGIAVLRSALWPGGLPDEHRQEIAAVLQTPNSEKTVFVATDETGTICGFAEASLRRDYVNGCQTSPVSFLEGIYVDPANQRHGLARQLCLAVEVWSREKGCFELASDASLENLESHAFHIAAGFQETERVVYFCKQL